MPDQDTQQTPLWRKIFNYVAGYGPALGLVIGGGLVAVDYGVTGRLDLLLGGGALSLLGLMIADTVSGLNVLSDKFMRTVTGKPVNPGTLMGTIGLASVALLGGGELLNLWQKYGLNIGNLTDMGTLSKVFADAAIYKVIANFTAYTAISLMDFPAAGRWAQKYMSENQYRMLQTALSFTGAVLIYKFGADGRIFSAVRFGQLNIATGGAALLGRGIKETELVLQQP